MSRKFVVAAALVGLFVGAGADAQSGSAPAPVELTAEQDHKRLLELLGIQSLRPGADPRNASSPNAPNYDEARANPYPTLPDPLLSNSGKRVKTPQAWWEERRAEIVEHFDREVYGRVPANVPGVRWEVVSTTHEKVGGFPVVTKQLIGHADNSAYPQVEVGIELSVTTPAQTAIPVPVVMELWLRPRNPASKDWREQVLAKGWGFALLTPTSIQADNGAGLTRGIIGLANQGQPRKVEDWGVLRAWAWGASRALDYLETDKAVDARRVVIEGLSRYGKAALVAMAYDPRFAIGFIGSSGAGGAKLHRRDFGERVENLASPGAYHWMAGNYLKYAGPLTAKDLPVDAHELIALAAPRPLFIGAGSQEVEGGWIDARGMFMATAAAGPVYRLLGRQDLGTSTFPTQETALVSGDLAFRQHSGGHTNGPNWETFLAFADRSFSGKPLLSSLFHDRSVLQRDKPVRVWGWTKAGESVSVSIASSTASARADASGRWIATLPAMKAGGPHALSVRTAGGATASARDILIGDVWLCAGQSNMVLQVNRTLDARAEIARPANDSIRMLTLDLVNRSTPLEDVASIARWQSASPSTVGDFSATCFYFARELQKTVGVPMGLINSSWGGARIEAFMSADALRSTGAHGAGLELLSLQARDPAAATLRWGEQWQAWWRDRTNGRSSAEPWGGSPDIARNWKAVPEPSKPWEEWGLPELVKYDGVVWYRTSFTLDAKQAEQSAILAFGPVDEVDTTWVNGKPVGYTSGAGTPRSYAVPAGTLRAGENTIAVAALDTYATGGMLGPLSQRKLTLTDGTVVTLSAEWKYQVAPGDMGAIPRAPWEATGGLTTIYNAMIAPLEPYTLRGVVWYQGESNTEDAAHYGTLLKEWMGDWRNRFAASSLPFLIVQLPNYGPVATAPSESGWAQLREAQRAVVAQDRNAGLVVTIDIGDRYDIHPTNKQEVGRRLARTARHVVYGEAVAPSGPVAKSAMRSGSDIVVTFEDVQGRLLAYGAQRAIGFELCAASSVSASDGNSAGSVAGASRGSGAAACQFVDATADGQSARIAAPAGAPSGAAITRVRYCWADSPVCTLFDESGLPAGPFELTVQ